MTSLSVNGFLPSLRLKLGTKALIGAALVIAVNTALVLGAAYWSLSSEFAERARRDIDANLRTFALAFAETFKDAKITLKDGAVGRIEIAQIPDLKDHAVVDRAVSYVGGSATLFVFDEASNQFVRRSTNVKKER
jgi:methyl-accepting chemotaxis protein